MHRSGLRFAMACSCPSRFRRPPLPGPTDRTERPCDGPANGSAFSALVKGSPEAARLRNALVAQLESQHTVRDARLAAALRRVPSHAFAPDEFPAGLLTRILRHEGQPRGEMPVSWAAAT